MKTAAQAKPSPAKRAQVGGALVTLDRARDAYLARRRFDLKTLAALFEKAPDSVEIAGKPVSS